MSTAPAPRKSFGDTVLTATPVALTVVATVLAGLSSSEMSKAQYYRAIAAQDQSKTSDEWAFFQAKKYRATYSTGTAAQLRLQSTRQPFTPAVLTALVDRSTDDLQSFDSAAGALKEHATTYRQGLHDRIQAFKNVKEPLAKELSYPQVQNAFYLLATEELPAAEGTAKAANVTAALNNDLEAINADFPTAFKAIDTHRPKDELDALCNRITEQQIRDALAAVESHTERFDRAQAPIGEALERIGGVVDDYAMALAWAREGARDLHREAGDSTEVAALERRAETAEAEANRRAADFSAARLRYNARRYNHEARYNQTAAWLHEIQVNKSGLTSERHRKRSGLFFLGMLGAQAGVTIATLSLALRQRSVLWGLATVAGLAAVAFAGFVYLFV